MTNMCADLHCCCWFFSTRRIFRCKFAKISRTKLCSGSRTQPCASCTAHMESTATMRKRSLARIAAVCSALTLTLGPLSPAIAQNPPAAGSAVQARGGDATGSIRGVVFDSLLMTPLRGATITLLGRVETTTSDARGRFSFERVPPGGQTVMFTSPALDSLGLGVMGTEFDLIGSTPANLSLTTPSLRTLWQRRCGGATAVGGDSGIVWGTIRSAATGAPIADAVAAMSWYSLRTGTKRGLVIDDLRQDAITDVHGLYFMCGVPSGSRVSATAVDTSSQRGRAASGVVEYVVGPRRLQLLDLTVSTDMVEAEPKTPEDSARTLSANDSGSMRRARGRATLKGIVVGDNGHPVTDAIVGVASADTSVRTNAQGEFVLGGLPAGTHSVQTRRVGYSPIDQVVALRSDSVSQIRIVSSKNVLATYNVRATLTKGADRVEFEQRRKQGFGYAFEGKQLENKTDIGNLLRTVPGLDVQNRGFDLLVTVAGGMQGRCKPKIIVDGFPSSMDVVSMHRPADFRAIEVFTRGTTAPTQYTSLAGCGVLLFWSRAGANW